MSGWSHAGTRTLDNGRHSQLTRSIKHLKISQWILVSEASLTLTLTLLLVILLCHSGGGNLLTK